MNENSSGSVMPVRNAVSAVESMMPPTTFRCDGLASLPDGQGGRGQGEHHDREEAGHEDAGGRVAGEEPVQVAVAPPL